MNFLVTLAIIAGILTPHASVAAPNHEETETKEEEILTVDELITREFGEDSIMHRIAYCESGKRQFKANGEVITGVVHSPDTGTFQINLKVWASEAEKLGLDVYTTEGNVKMARHILNTQGLSAWEPSRHCWGQHLSTELTVVK